MRRCGATSARWWTREKGAPRAWFAALLKATDQGPAPVRGEAAFNAPWPVLALIAVLLAAHSVRLAAGVAPERFALIDDDLQRGRLSGLVTHLLVHGSWAHVLLNSVFVLAFGAPVSRGLGTGARGAAAFLGFFVACGVVAGMAYAGMESARDGLGAGARGGWALAGASGAASGLLGAAARFIEGRGRLGSATGRSVVAMTVMWIVANTLLGVSGMTPGAAGLAVAWQAHIFGFLAGLLMIGPFQRLSGGPGSPRPRRA